MSQLEKNSNQNGFSFVSAMEAAMENLSERSRQILRERYGTADNGPQTLENIGKKYSITRERVRQIIREAIKKIRANGDGFEMGRAIQKIEFTVKQNSGIIRVDELVGQLVGKDKKEKGAINFFLECTKKLATEEKKGELALSVSASDFDSKKWTEVRDQVKKILDREAKSLKIKDIYDKYPSQARNFKIEELGHYIDVAEEIRKNRFEKWGLAEWSDISPKGAKQKAHAVLKENRKPMHFREIAKHIDKYYPGKKKSHPQTVHNELIKDGRFVLVGRGVYALKEWGYKKGTVKEVLEDILKEKSQPMGREDIIAEILKRRRVQRTTIMINLNNFFAKVDKDKYTIKK